MQHTVLSNMITFHTNHNGQSYTTIDPRQNDDLQGEA